MVSATDPLRRRVVRLAATLMRARDDERALGELQAVAATLYGLGAEERAIVAADFPRLSPNVRARLLQGD